MFGRSGNDLHGREKANYLVEEVGKRMHVSNVRLDSDDDRSLGEFGFHFDAHLNILAERVFIAKAYLDEGDPEATAGFRKTAVALNDPKIGGIFESGGGHFLLDEKKQKYFLLKDYPVESISAKDLWLEVEDQLDLGARWSLKWARLVGRMSHGSEPLPTRPITRKK